MKQRRRACVLEAKHRKSGTVTKLALYDSSNSLGECTLFCGKRPGNKKEFAPLRGYPLYAAQSWLVSNGYTYQVT